MKSSTRKTVGLLQYDQTLEPQSKRDRLLVNRVNRLRKAVSKFKNSGKVVGEFVVLIEDLENRFSL